MPIARSGVLDGTRRERRGRPANVSWGSIIAGVVTFLAVTVLLSLAAFWVVYLTLIGLDVFLLTRTARAGMHEPDTETASIPAPEYLPEGARP